MNTLKRQFTVVLSLVVILQPLTPCLAAADDTSVRLSGSIKRARPDLKTVTEDYNNVNQAVKTGNPDAITVASVLAPYPGLSRSANSAGAPTNLSPLPETLEPPTPLLPPAAAPSATGVANEFTAPPPAQGNFNYQVALADDSELRLEGNNVTVFDNGRKGLVLATYRGERGLYVLTRNAGTGIFNRQSIQPAPDNIQGAWLKTPAISPDGKHLAGVVNAGGTQKLVAMTRDGGNSLDFQDPKYLLNANTTIPTPTEGVFKNWRFFGDASFTPDDKVLFNIVRGGRITDTFKYDWSSSAQSYENLAKYSGAGFSDLKNYRPGDIGRNEQGVQYWYYSPGPTPQTDGVEMVYVADSSARGLKILTMKFLPEMPMHHIPGGQWMFPMKEFDPVKWVSSVSPIGSFYQGNIGDKIIVWSRGTSKKLPANPSSQQQSNRN